MRPCLAASRAACRAAQSCGGFQTMVFRTGNRCLCNASAAEQTRRLEQDLAEVLREPQVREHFSAYSHHRCMVTIILLCRQELQKRELTNPYKAGSFRSYKLLLLLGGEKSKCVTYMYIVHVACRHRKLQWACACTPGCSLQQKTCLLLQQNICLLLFLTVDKIKA